MKKEMLINVLQPEETRIAILENGVLEELYVERVSNESYVGNIYKGRVVNIEPSIQAAFVDFGVGRNGFLHISDIDPSYFGEKDGSRERGERGERGERRGGEGRRGRPEPRPTPEPDAERESGEDEELGPRDVPASTQPPRQGDRDRGRGRGRPDPEGRRGGRRRGRRGRGGRRPESMPDDLPEELIADNASLPDLEDYRVDEEFAPSSEEPAEEIEDLLEESPFGGERISIDESTIEVRSFSAPEAPPAPLEPAPPAPAPAEEEDVGFGEGLFDDEDPPAQPHQGHFRSTDDDEGFGRGIFDEDDEEQDESESDSDSVDEEDATSLLDEEAVGPEPRQSRYEDDEPLESWSEMKSEEEEPDEDEEADEEEEAVSSAPLAEAPARSETAEETEAPRKRRRRRRGGRGRRSRRDESETAGEGRAPAEEERGERPEEDADDEEEPAFDDMDDTPAPLVEDRPRRPPGRNGDRRGPRERRGGPGRTGFGSARRPRERPPIQSILKRGQEVLVQVIKEGIGNKGPTLSTYVSIPGRYLVLMPGLNRVGVSRKIVDDEQRRRLRDILNQIERPPGVGFIIRTAGLERTKAELERDLAYLLRLWEVVNRRIKNQKGPGCIYQESDMIIRTIRDIFTSEIDVIYVDEPNAYERAKEFLQIVMPKYVDRLKLYDKPEPLFHHTGIEDEISKIQKREVPLPRGGSIVIDQTEALVAIDVNSGNFRTDGSAEDTAFQINMAAVKEICRQLRLRDLGGVIVNDFIDMREERHRRAVEHAMREAVKRDRARTKILRMSAFGIIEMTRQRIRPSLRRSLYRECSVCHGTGQMKTVESVAIECMRLLSFIGHRGDVRRIQITLHHEVASHLQNHKRRALAELERQFNLELVIVARELKSPEDEYLVCYGDGGEPIELNLGIPTSPDDE